MCVSRRPREEEGRRVVIRDPTKKHSFDRQSIIRPKAPAGFRESSDRGIGTASALLSAKTSLVSTIRWKTEAAGLGVIRLAEQEAGYAPHVNGATAHPASLDQYRRKHRRLRRQTATARTS